MPKRLLETIASLVIKNLAGVISNKITWAINRSNLEYLEYYGQAEQEINDGTFNKGLWAKALTKANGNEDRRKAEYIKLRVKQLQKER